MTRGLLAAVLAAAACTHGAAPAEVPHAEHRPARPSRWSDAEWAWLTALGDAIEPRWASFLSDCRTRLPAAHALNAPALRATLELTLAGDGKLVRHAFVAPSGNADFDRAILDVVRDAAPFAAPPVDAASDDELVHVRWTFTREATTSGAEAAELLRVRLPLAQAIEVPLARGDTTAAAARIVAAHDATAAERADAEDRVMVTALAHALDSSSDEVARAAAAGIRELAVTHPALVAAIAPAAAQRFPAPVAEAHAPAPPHLGRGAKSRAEACDAAGHRPAPPKLPPRRPPDEIVEGVADRDETVRVRCLAAATSLYAGTPPRTLDAAIRPHLHDKSPAVRAAVVGATAIPAAELRGLATDPDADVRAVVLAKLAAPDLWISAVDDPAPQVRIEAARALDRLELLERLAADESPDVAGAALGRLAQLRGPDVIGPELLVRLAAAPRRSRDRVRIALAWLRLR